MFFLFALVATGIGVAVAAAASSKVTRTDPPPKRTSGGFESDQRDIETEDPWSCERAKKQPVPDVQSWMGAAGSAGGAAGVSAGGPIAAVIVAGVAIVRKVFEAIGAKKVCTVRGGRYHALVVVPRSPAKDFKIIVEVMYPFKVGAQWTFRATRSDTGPLPLIEKLGGGPADGGKHGQYLANGGEPPGDLWPHVNIPRWQSWVPPELDEPLADVVRSGDDMTVGVWLPPRAPKSHVTQWGKRKVDAPVTWRITWVIA